MPRSRKNRRPPPSQPAEARSAEVATVFWMLATMTALFCELGSALANLLADGGAIQLLSNYLLFAAAVTGGVSLLLLPAVYKLRRVAPPRGVTVFALVVALVPFAALLLAAIGE